MLDGCLCLGSTSLHPTDSCLVFFGWDIKYILFIYWKEKGCHWILNLCLTSHTSVSCVDPLIFWGTTEISSNMDSFQDLSCVPVSPMLFCMLCLVPSIFSVEAEFTNSASIVFLTVFSLPLCAYTTCVHVKSWDLWFSWEMLNKT